MHPGRQLKDDAATASQQGVSPFGRVSCRRAADNELLFCSWTKFAWARDKQYLVAEKPGSSVTFEVEVGPGGQVLADWLHSRFYDLGDVVVCALLLSFSLALSTSRTPN